MNSNKNTIKAVFCYVNWNSAWSQKTEWTELFVRMLFFQKIWLCWYYTNRSNTKNHTNWLVYDHMCVHSSVLVLFRYFLLVTCKSLRWATGKGKSQAGQTKTWTNIHTRGHFTLSGLHVCGLRQENWGTWRKSTGTLGELNTERKFTKGRNAEPRTSATKMVWKQKVAVLTKTY